MRTGFIRCLTLLLAAGVARSEPAAVKRVGAPASDIVSGVVAMPEADQLGVRSRTALLPVRLAPAARGDWVWTGTVDLGPDAALGVLSDRAWSVEIADAMGVGLPVPTPGATADAIAGAPGLVITSASGDLPRQLGTGRAGRVSLRGLKAGAHAITLRSDRPGAGFLLVDAGGGASLYTHPTGLRRVVGEPIGLRPWLDGARVTGVIADVFTPDGASRRVGADADGVVRFTPVAEGRHAVRVEVSGIDAAGQPVVLTTQHLVPVARAGAPFAVLGVRETGGVAVIDLGGAGDQRSITAAEVWGRRGGEMVPVCWVSQLGDGHRELAIDLRWASMAGVDAGSLELRNLREHEVGSYALVAFEGSMPLTGAGATLPPDPGAITPGMRTGMAGAVLVESPLAEPAGPRAVSPGHRLLLVHGYCSPGNPFTLAHFSGDVSTFADPDQSRSQDEFAQLILSQGSAAKSFGVVGHSQGPMAALHLSTYYWSGLDWAQGNRLIQAVGAPFQGTPLAGDAAVLGQVFGAGCGSNDDMTYDGAGAWLSLIPTAPREQVWYWTTSYTDRPFLYDYCNFITDLLLSDPDDGVIERDRAQLAGAHNRGHREGWCHTAGMRDPAQTTDASRNAEMNQKARR